MAIKPTALDAELLDRMADFLSRFELVFSDDWHHTAECLRDDSRGDFIDPGGTFLDPRVESEGANWGNRGGLLDAYRNLAEAMAIAGVVRRPF